MPCLRSARAVAFAWTVAATTSACSAQKVDAPVTAGRSSADLTTEDAPGYVHDLAHSRFRFGGVPIARSVGAGTRYEGPEGAAFVGGNQSFVAVPNAGAPSTRDPYQGTGDAHTAEVRSYLVGAGLPEAQIASSGVGTTVTSAGSTESAGATSTEAYTTTLTRAVEGFRVAESIASVGLNAAGDAVTESIYWPRVPGATVADAKRLAATLADAAEGPRYRERVAAAGADAARGAVVIHHSPLVSDHVGDMTVTFDAPRTGAGAIVHFDMSGQELRLPSEVAPPTQ